MIRVSMRKQGCYLRKSRKAEAGIERGNSLRYVVADSRTDYLEYNAESLDEIEAWAKQ